MARRARSSAAAVLSPSRFASCSNCRHPSTRARPHGQRAAAHASDTPARNWLRVTLPPKLDSLTSARSCGVREGSCWAAVGCEPWTPNAPSWKGRDSSPCAFDSPIRNAGAGLLADATRPIIHACTKLKRTPRSLLPTRRRFVRPRHKRVRSIKCARELERCSLPGPSSQPS